MAKLGGGVNASPILPYHFAPAWAFPQDTFTKGLAGKRARAIFLLFTAMLPFWYAMLLTRLPRDYLLPHRSSSIDIVSSPLHGLVRAARGLMTFGGRGETIQRDPRNLDLPEMFQCDHSSPLTDYCVVQGDVRVDCRTGEIVLYTRDPLTPLKNESVRPYPRKWDDPVMASISEQTIQPVQHWGGGKMRHSMRKLKQAPYEETDHAEVLESASLRKAFLRGNSYGGAPEGGDMRCTSYEDGPAILFSAGGYSGGIFHDFNEVFLPLFQTAHEFRRDVTLIVSDLKGDWWFRGPAKDSFAGAFTRHPIRLLRSDTDADGNAQGVGCFTKLIVGLKHNLCLYDEWGGKEERDEVKAGVRLRHFAPNVMKAMRVPEDIAVSDSVGQDVQTPVVCLVQRQTTRRFVNYDQLRAVTLEEGFRVLDVVFEELTSKGIVETMQKCDALIGVHGAGFTNTIFMRPKKAIVQVMPFGEHSGDLAVGKEYRTIANALSASYMEWRVPAQDSTLWTQFNATDVEIADPEQLWRTDLMKAMSLYHSQDVKIPEAPFRTLLEQVRAALVAQEE